MNCPHCNQEDKLLLRLDRIVICWNCQNEVKSSRIKIWRLKRKILKTIPK